MSGRCTSVVEHPADRRGRRGAVVAVVLVVLAASLAGVLNSYTGEARAATQSARRPHSDALWTHIFQVIAKLNANPPKVPLVYLLGGSSAVDSTVSDQSWTTQVGRLVHRRVRAYNFGSTTQTYAQDVTIVNHLPTLPSIVLIGVNLGRYTGSVARAVRAWPAGTRPADGSGGQARSVTVVLSDAQKRQYVRAWLRIRYPLFKQNFAGNAAQLELLVSICQARGLHPVLLELPLNLPIVRHAFDKPRVQYRDSCRALAKKYTIPKINFLKRTHLVSSDFADLFHLVEPGRVKWQLRLSKTVVSLLARYGMESP